MLTMFIQAKIVGSMKMLGSLIPAGVPLCLAQAGIIGSDTGLSLVVVGSVIGGAWYLSARLTKIEDTLKALKADNKISDDKVEATATALAVVTTATAAALAAATAAANSATTLSELHKLSIK